MSMHRKTITLTEQQDDWVKGQVESGHFGNDSECISRSRICACRIELC